MNILAIETSCDETAIAIISASGDDPKTATIQVLANVVLSQAQKHAEYGGVFPSLAKREHAKNLVPVLETSLQQADMLNPGATELSEDRSQSIQNILGDREPELLSALQEFFKQYGVPPIDRIAVTNGPGLEPALWVGINLAKALAVAWNVPVTPTNHLAGHVWSVLVPPNAGRNPFTLNSLPLPALALLVSGKHSELVLIKGYGDYTILGKTQDDAAGEAFDKVARMLDLPYPGGPHISRLAKGGQPEPHITLPRPMIGTNDYNFSFSGLKTAVLYLIRDLGGTEALSEIQKAAIAREFQDAVIDVLLKKTVRAVDEYGTQALIIGGGVSANQELRQRFTDTLAAEAPQVELRIPDISLATDNALMIAMAALFEDNNQADPAEIRAIGNLNL